jgi:potassium-transporting ATPase KdpC subunit
MFVLTIVTGVAYPLIVTGVAQLAFPHEANGSVMTSGGKAVGSVLIAQPFTQPGYFWPRPSAAKYDGSAGSGSNLGPSNPALHDAMRERTDALRASDPGNNSPVPIDLVTASGSGLDPHISLAAAKYQIGRVARAREMPVSDVQKLVERFSEPRTLGFFGEPRVNVSQLNLALDGRQVSTKSPSHDPGIGTRWPMSTH